MGYYTSSEGLFLGLEPIFLSARGGRAGKKGALEGNNGIRLGVNQGVCLGVNQGVRLGVNLPRQEPPPAGGHRVVSEGRSEEITFLILSPPNIKSISIQPGKHYLGIVIISLRADLPIDPLQTNTTKAHKKKVPQCFVELISFLYLWCVKHR